MQDFYNIGPPLVFLCDVVFSFESLQGIASFKTKS
jgi:hypothetical protein